MDVSSSRSQFLCGDFSGEGAPIRPPWSVREQDFLARCTMCTECVTACPEHIVIKGRGAYPQLDFQRGECTFCAQCVSHCASGALDASRGAPWDLSAHIGGACLARDHNVVCQTCAEQCEAGAIQFRFVAGRVPQPQLDAALCTGCGACFGPCPTRAIQLRTEG